MTPQSLRALVAITVVVFTVFALIIIEDFVFKEDPPIHHTDVRNLGRVGNLKVHAVHDTEKNVTCYVTTPRGGICCVRGL